MGGAAQFVEVRKLWAVVKGGFDRNWTLIAGNYESDSIGGDLRASLIEIRREIVKIKANLEEFPRFSSNQDDFCEKFW